MLKISLSTIVPFNVVCGLLLCSTFAASKASACSAFSPEGRPMLAANYDWQVSGGMIVTNPRGLRKQAFLPDQRRKAPAAAWTSRYASLTLTQWGREFPMQGINERGLAGVVLNGPAEYPTSIHLQITEMQWLQYQLDRFATIEEVKNHADEFSVKKLSGNLHYFLCDKTAACAWVAIVKGHLEVRSDLEVRAIANSGFDPSMAIWSQFRTNQGSAAQLPQGYLSLHRFVRAAWASEHSEATVDKLLSELRGLGANGWTNWHTVMDTQLVATHVTLWKSRQTLRIKRNEFSFDCRTPVRSRMMQTTSVDEWKFYEPSAAAALLARASVGVPGLSAAVQKRMIDYPQTFECQSR